MNESKKAAYAVKLIAVGYLFMYLNVNLLTIDVLPDFVCYILILKALPYLAEDEPSALLLRPLGIILLIWQTLQWLFGIFSFSAELYGLGIIISIINLYFHFQLLTNIAHIAEKYDCPQKRKLLVLRTVQTLLLTVMAIPVPWNTYLPVTIAILVVQLIIAFWICAVLFSLKNSLNKITVEELSTEIQSEGIKGGYRDEGF